MKKLFIVTKNELKRYFVSPLAYVYLLSFLILNGSFAIYFGDFFNRGQADLSAMFVYQPWLYLLFIPGIAMRLWAEEFRTKTIVQIVTMPVSIKTLVLGKFFAAWIFCGMALLLTFPFIITVNVLGNPDNSVIALGYIASFCLAGCILAISQTMSALTKNQVIALVLSVLANLVFFWSGIEYILSFFRLFLPTSIIDVIASFSFLSHFGTLTSGLAELRDVIFFLSIIIFFNFTTILIINFKTAGTSGWLRSNNKQYYIVAWFFLLLGFFGINIIANNLTRNIQYDATQEKFYTLTNDTKAVLKNLKEPVVGRLYFTSLLAKRNSGLRNMYDHIRLLLQQYRDVSDGKFDFKTYDAKFLSDEEDIALANGLQPIPLIDLNQNALFGITFEDTLQNKSALPFFSISRMGNLEQDLTAKIYQLHHQKKTVAFVSSLPIFGDIGVEAATIRSRWKIIDLISETYNTLEIKKAEDFKEKFDVLVLFFPQNLSDEYVKSIKDYSKKGGNIIAILDPANEASRIYSPVNTRLTPSNLNGLDTFWGFKFYDEYVVADLKNSITVDATTDYETNPVFTQDVIQFVAKKDEMNPYHPITKHLNRILFDSASVFSPLEEPLKSGKIRFIPFLKASDISKIMPANVVIDNMNPQNILNYFEPDDNQKILGAEIIGQTPNNPFHLIVIGDSDFLYDTFWSEQESLLKTSYIISNFDNANLLLNSLDYLTHNADLITLRGKEMETRNFSGIELTRRLESLNYKKKENKILEEIDTVKKGLQEVWSKKNFEGRENFTADELSIISNIRNNMNRLRQQLSDVRYEAYTSLNHIAKIVTFINIWVVPLLITLILLVLKLIIIIHNKKYGFNIYIDRKLGKLALVCLTIFAISLVTIYLNNLSTLDSYEGKWAFEKVRDNLNNINTIKLQSHSQTLTFKNENNIWHLQEQPDFPVLQKRMRRLLTIIADAKTVALKSNKAENFAMFNLLPIEDANSKALHVSLNNNDTVIQEFDLGDINVDLGRGGKAAYVRYGDIFNVYEIDADFVDMQPDWQKWTYSNLWDLRYGRFYKASNISNEDNLMEFIKYALNTKIQKVLDLPKDAKFVKSSALSVEDGNHVNIKFYKNNDSYYAMYIFDKNNSNEHLKFVAPYYTNKALLINNEDAEKIIDAIK